MPSLEFIFMKTKYKHWKNDYITSGKKKIHSDCSNMKFICKKIKNKIYMQVVVIGSICAEMKITVLGCCDYGWIFTYPNFLQYHISIIKKLGPPADSVSRACDS